MICRTCRAALRTPRLAPLLTLPSPPRLTTILPLPPSSPLLRSFSSSSPPLRTSSNPPQPSSSDPGVSDDSSMSPAESHIASLLASNLRPTRLLVQDISGGCGSMYAIDVASPLFKGLSMLKQQRMVNAALGGLVKEWHGVQIRTEVSPDV